MSERKLVVTILVGVEQVGPDDFVLHRESRVFSCSRPVEDWYSWARACGVKNPQFGQFVVSEYTGESF